MEQIKIFGIDFGTTNTVITYFENNKSNILIDGVYKSIPSKIGLNSNNNKIYCGNYIPLNVDNIIYNFKTLIGSDYTINFDNKILTLNELLIIFFNHIKKIIIKKFTNITEFKVVITVPSNFNDNQREIIKACFINVGFSVLRIINEPSSAALAYGLNKSSLTEERILVIDIGGGTLDITVLIKDDNFFTVESSMGINDLGGNNFTDIIYNYIENLISTKSDINKNNLWYLCQKAKEKLSYLDNFEIKTNNLIFTISKTQFEKLSTPLINRIKNLLSDMDNKIDRIILVGSSSKIPFLQKNIHEIFNIKPWVHPNLESVVSEGACLYGGIIENIYKNDLDNNIILIDVLPLSLGVETIDGLFSVIVSKNTPLPIKRNQKYTTDSPSEKTVKIKVYQGERKIANKNTLIGEFIFDKISLGGVPIIDICFKVDLNGIINVIVTDKKSGIDKNILIKDLPKLDIKVVESLIEIANYNDDNDQTELLFKSRKYQIITKIEIVMNNIQINNKINENNKNELISELDKIEQKLETIQDITNENNVLLLNIIYEIDTKYNLYTQSLFIEDDIETRTDLEIIIIIELKDELNNKINLLLNKNPEWEEYLNPILEKLTESNITLEYLQEKLNIIKELDDENNEDINYKEEFKNLCLFIKNELEVGNIIKSIDKLNELNNLINYSIDIIENTDTSIDWKQKLLDINNFCENL